jgi:diaminopimelate epimerase
VTACALVYALQNKTSFSKQNSVAVQVKGGNLQIRFERDDKDGFQNIWLCGPAVKVFEVNKFIF